MQNPETKIQNKIMMAMSKKAGCAGEIRLGYSKQWMVAP